MKQQRVVVVGAGMAGLTAAAYLARAGHTVRVLEKTGQSGGLVASFERDGFVFDTGPRAIGNAGILKPMLAELGIDLPLVSGLVSTGIAGRIVHHDSDAGVDGYLATLRDLYPLASESIDRIGRWIRRSKRLTRNLNRLPNPYFKNPLLDPAYLFRDFLPWLPAFLEVALRTAADRRPVEQVLDGISEDRGLKDLVAQHFFKGTPAHFAFGYFENFLDYLYPLGGTGRLPEALEGRARGHGATVLYGREVRRLDPAARLVEDQLGERHPYDRLLWAADLKSLYDRLDASALRGATLSAIRREQQRYRDARPGESVFTLFLALDLPPEHFAAISRGHFIYTPKTEGLGELHRSDLAKLKAGFAAIDFTALDAWLDRFCRQNSYEISIPVLKDPSLAPPGQTGLVVSLLFDGELCRMVEERGWLADFKAAVTERMVDTLEGSVYPGLRDKLLFATAATPRTLERRFLSSGGAITGWSLEAPAPVPSTLLSVLAASRTAIPGVCKAGQWSYSPSGVPIAILTGRIAAAALDRRRLLH